MKNRWWAALAAATCLAGATASAQTASVDGAVRDETGGTLPGVTVELRSASSAPLAAVTDAQGRFRFDGLAAGHYQAAFTLINFASAHREVDVTSTGAARLDAVLISR